MLCSAVLTWLLVQLAPHCLSASASMYTATQPDIAKIEPDTSDFFPYSLAAAMKLGGDLQMIGLQRLVPLIQHGDLGLR